MEADGGSSGGATGGGKSEFDDLITAYTSPVPSHILTDYDKKSKNKKTMIE